MTPMDGAEGGYNRHWSTTTRPFRHVEPVFVGNCPPSNEDWASTWREVVVARIGRTVTPGEPLRVSANFAWI
ncbi:hypothetical protein N7540_001960 [Penicillium herquei]|nr:hypothetical protein N7540_001960 [Penicillium herquei]